MEDVNEAVHSELTTEREKNEMPRSALSSGSLPLALKWSISIATLIGIIMGLLGWFLIQQQEESFQRQSGVMGKMLVEQVARSASEPLLADDAFALELLVSQLEKNPLIVGMQIFDLKATAQASAGVDPFQLDTNMDPQRLRQLVGFSGGVGWSADSLRAQAFVAEIRFKDVMSGYAVVSIDRTPFEQDLERVINALLMTTLGLMALGVILSIPLAHQLCKPIYRLVELGEAIHSGKKPSQGLSDEGRGDEIGRVLELFRHLSDDLEEKRDVEKALSKYVSPKVAKQVLASARNGTELSASTTNASILFCDIVGFTELSETLPPEEVAALLNHYFRYFSLAANSCQGTIDKFIGDCVMILFGVPETDRHHALHAVTCAVLIQEIAQHINRQRASRGLATVSFRIGINSGSVMAGNLGGEERAQYTVVGDVVNVASRLCDLCEPGGILLTAETAEQPQIRSDIALKEGAEIQVKGRRQAVRPYAIDRSSLSQAAVIEHHLGQILPQG